MSLASFSFTIWSTTSRTSLVANGRPARPTSSAAASPSPVAADGQRLPAIDELPRNVIARHFRALAGALAVFQIRFRKPDDNPTSAECNMGADGRHCATFAAPRDRGTTPRSREAADPRFFLRGVFAYGRMGLFPHGSQRATHITPRITASLFRRRPPPARSPTADSRSPTAGPLLQASSGFFILVIRGGGLQHRARQARRVHSSVNSTP